MLKRKREDQKRQKYLLLAVLLLLFPLLLIGAATLTHVLPRLSLYEPRLAYSGDGYEHTINLATGERFVTGLAEAFPNRSAVSNDGTWLAEWAVAVGPTWILKITHIPTNELREFGPFEIAYPTLSWSPDSKWLAFAAGNLQIGVSEGMELVLLNIENGALKQLTNNGFRDDSPAFSPDGTRLVFTSSEDGYNRLHILDLETGKRHLLTPYIFGYSPAWSPDGSLIAFMSNQDEVHGEIYVIGADGTGFMRLTDDARWDESPRWLR
jgi:Tol biopolymer transport system component